ncbi:hypothetical protein IWX90DRAFT_423242 [Phyllosticta citrichinensis]|uniref:F-box domain-containing protein n=1 Tax=Phyllosticta citrichinensis TaxID=1130410 RepID=A0ABR1Y1N9_9PEZI
MADPINPATATEAELESFRRKWREEVQARTKQKAGPSQTTGAPAQASSSKAQSARRNKAPAIAADHERREGIDEAEPHAYHDLGEKESGRKLNEPAPPLAKVPESALELYEEAVKREAQGKLGDSVNLYRRAFKLDDAVQEIYRKKHFPAAGFPKPGNPNPSNAPVTVPNTAHHSLAGVPSSLTDLISSFSALSIPGVEPPTDLSPPPPCPIADLPEELLAQILLHVAMDDVAELGRLSQVCKRLAYLVMTEDSIWRRVALSKEFGFTGMHYRWACKLDGSPVGDDGEGGRLLSSFKGLPEQEEEEARETAKFVETALHTLPMVPNPYPNFRALFRSRPRVRFSGCYISCVNYTRPGANHSNSLSWSSPVLIVTYYRYLRLFRDGTCIALLTTAEPQDVVPHLTKDYLHGRNGAHAHSALPQVVMKDALPGRWRLSGPEHGVDAIDPLLSSSSDPASPSKPPSSTTTSPHPAAPQQQQQQQQQQQPLFASPAADSSVSAPEPEGTLHVETAGVRPRYIYRMALALGSAGKTAPRNNKLSWLGYWSYNRLTDDWAEFGLKNDKPFYWSRVKRWS